jgi:hypothetical protein
MLAGFTIMVLLLPLIMANGLLAKKQSRLSKALSKAKLTFAVINGIRAIKYGAWVISLLAQIRCCLCPPW